MAFPRVCLLTLTAVANGNAQLPLGSEVDGTGLSFELASVEGAPKHLKVNDHPEN